MHSVGSLSNSLEVQERFQRAVREHEFRGVSFVERLKTMFLLAFASAIGTVVLYMFLQMLNVPLPGVQKHRLPALRFGNLQPETRNHSAVFKAESQRRKEMARSAAFVSNVIQQHSSLSNQDADQLAVAIVLESDNAGVDPLFVTAVIKAESTFRPSARSRVGARGLMQLMPSTAEYITQKTSIDWRGTSALEDPNYNIRLGIAYLKYLKRFYGEDRYHSLVAYNWGPTNVNRARKNGKRFPKVSDNYARSILKNLEHWRSQFRLVMASNLDQRSALS